MSVNLDYGKRHRQQKIKSTLGVYYLFHCLVEGQTKEFYWQDRENYCPICGEELPPKLERITKIEGVEE